MMNLSDLTPEERRILAYRALVVSRMQDDFRYWNPDEGERARIRARWQEIAELLDPEDGGRMENPC